jgi:hypothetical protein
VCCMIVVAEREQNEPSHDHLFSSRSHAFTCNIKIHIKNLFLGTSLKCCRDIDKQGNIYQQIQQLNKTLSIMKTMFCAQGNIIV